MADMNEIIADYSGPGSGGKLSVFHFQAGADLADQRQAIADLLGAADAFMDNAYSWSVRQSGRVLNDVTGGLVDEWADAGTLTGTGASVGQATADSTQALFRWGTGAVVGGRFLKGRTFLPGLESNSFTDGNLSSTVQAGLNSAAIGMAGSGVGFCIWHRPKTGSGGTTRLVNSGSVWAEAAVLRRRRG